MWVSYFRPDPAFTGIRNAGDLSINKDENAPIFVSLTLALSGPLQRGAETRSGIEKI